MQFETSQYQRNSIQKLSDEGHIRFTKPDKRLILYDSASINEYFDKPSTSAFSWKKMKSIMLFDVIISRMIKSEAQTEG